jgi:hypothetical protein
MIHIPVLRTLIPAVSAWLACHWKHKAIAPVVKRVNELPESLARLIDDKD